MKKIFGRTLFATLIMGLLVSGQVVFAADAIPLPTNLVWHDKAAFAWAEDAQDTHGVLAWDVVEGFEECDYDITIYRNGKEILQTCWSGLDDNDENGRVGVDFVADGVFDQSGDLVVTVAVCDGTKPCHTSPVATSPVYHFVAPTQQLPAPTGVVWSSGYKVRYNTVENALGYRFLIYDQNREMINYMWSYGWYYHNMNNDVIEEDLGWFIKQNPTNSRGEPVEKMYIAVQALSADVERYRNSEVSMLGAPYEIDKKVTAANAGVSEALKQAEQGVSTQKVLDDFLQEMQEQSVSNDDLAVSMQQDENLVNDIGKLEQKYQEEHGVAVSVSTSGDDNYLAEQGIVAEEIQVVGAALNAKDNADVAINISKADQIEVGSGYKNAVSVNIDLDGVNDSKNLDIPIQIKMPVPANIDPYKMVILHYHEDGTVEHIRPYIQYEEMSRQVCAVFVLTSFSPFSFCEVEQADYLVSNVKEKDTGISFNLYIYNQESISDVTVLIAYYAESGQMISSDIQEFAVGTDTVQLLFDNVPEEYDSYKLFFLDGDGSMKPLTQLR